jgi:hypothetical protein
MRERVLPRTYILAKAGPVQLLLPSNRTRSPRVHMGRRVQRGLRWSTNAPELELLACFLEIGGALFVLPGIINLC